jgi:GNAT superfamily N-acetyltransferase
VARIEPFHSLLLRQLQQLLNAHLSALAPGWALSQDYIQAKLQRNPDEPLVDPWVIERNTLCAVENARLVAAAHLLRFGSGAEVGGFYQNAGEIAWLFAWPDATPATAALLAAAQGQMRAWNVRVVWAEMGSLVGPFVGVPDAWPHLATALVAAGFVPDPNRGEAVYGGPLAGVGPVGEAPLHGLTIARSSGPFGARFTARLDGLEVGACECVPDLTEGGALPALAGWAELTELEVAEAWRNRGIGSWLVRHAVAWLRLGRCDRILLAVAPESEAAGVDRFYGRCGWTPLVREQRGWRWSPAA